MWSTSRISGLGARINGNRGRGREEWVRYRARNVSSLRGRKEQLFEEKEKYVQA